MPGVCNVFLSHNRNDREWVRDIAEGLELEFGIAHFLDDYAIPPGEKFIPWIEKALAGSTGCAVFLGKNGWGPTHLWEAEKALQRYNRDPDFKLIPVILGEAGEKDRAKFGDGAVFRENNWVHFSQGALQRENLSKLRRVLTGEEIDSTRGPAVLTPYLLRRQAFRWHDTNDTSLLFHGQELLEAQKVRLRAFALADSVEIASFLQACETASIHRAWKVATSSVIISLVLIGSMLFAVNQMLGSQSRELVTLALASDQADTALLLTDGAYRIKRTPEAMRAFFTLLSRVPHVERYLHGHVGDVHAVALASDGSQVAAAGEGAQILVWDMTSPNRARWTFPAPDLPTLSANLVHALAFISGGDEVIVAYEWGGVRIWNLAQMQWRPITGWPAPSEYTLKTSTYWEGPDAEPPLTRGERPVTALWSAPNESRAVAGDYSGRLFVIDLARSVVERNIQTALLGIQAIILLPREGLILAAGGRELGGYALDGGGQVEFAKQPHTSPIVLLAQSGRGTNLLTLDSTGNLVWWTQAGRRFTLVRQVKLPLSPTAAELDQAGKLYVTTQAGTIHVLSEETGNELADAVRNGHRLESSAIRCAPSGSRCASGARGGEVIVWDNEQFHSLRSSHFLENNLIVALRQTRDQAIEVFTQPDHQLTSARLPAPENRTVQSAEGLAATGLQRGGDGIVMSFSDGRVEWRDSFGSKPALLKTRDEYPGGLDVLAVSASGRYVAGIFRQPSHVVLWDRTSSVLSLWEQPVPGFVSSLAFSPDERRLVAGTLEGLVIRWPTSPSPAEPESRKITQGSIFSLALLPLGNRLIVGSGTGDHRVRVLDFASLAVDRELPERHTSNVSRLAVSPDGSTLLSASTDGSVVLWDTASWQEVGGFSFGPNKIPQSVVLDDTTAYIATDREISSWRTSNESVRSTACGVANRPMAEQEWVTYARDIWPRRHPCASSR